MEHEIDVSVAVHVERRGPVRPGCGARRSEREGVAIDIGHVEITDAVPPQVVDSVLTGLGARSEE